MEIKKSPKADLKNKRGLLLEIGLVIALGVVVLAFMWTPKDYGIKKIDENLGPIDMDFIEITRENEPEPETPQKAEMKAMSDVLQMVTNETKISNTLEFQDFDDDMTIVTAVAPAKEEVADEEIFVKVEKMPSFQGGDINNFRSWVQKNINYPEIANENGIQGTVIIQFVIEKDGSVSNIKVLKDVDRSLSDEAVRIIKSSPKWQAGQQRGKAARVTYSMPVVFKLAN